MSDVLLALIMAGAPPPPWPTQPPAPKGWVDHCQFCGRFISPENSNVAWDDYCGGWEADPMCPTGKGCQKVTP